MASLRVEYRLGTKGDFQPAGEVKVSTSRTSVKIVESPSFIAFKITDPSINDRKSSRERLYLRFSGADGTSAISSMALVGVCVFVQSCGTTMPNSVKRCRLVHLFQSSCMCLVMKWSLVQHCEQGLIARPSFLPSQNQCR